MVVRQEVQNNGSVKMQKRLKINYSLVIGILIVPLAMLFAYFNFTNNAVYASRVFALILLILFIGFIGYMNLGEGSSSSGGQPKASESPAQPEDSQSPQEQQEGK
jgi:type IV secretory pathway TrbL component